MKKFLLTFMAGVVSLTMISCSPTPLTQTQYDLQVRQESARASCYQRLEARDSRLTTMLTAVPKDQVALVFVLTQMQENNKQLMAIATGNSADPCSMGTNAFDVQIAEVTAKNHAVEVVSGNLIDLGKFGLGVWGATAISSDLAHAGGTVVNGTDNSNTVTGTGNSVLTDNFKTQGEASTVGATLPAVDQSNTDTHTNTTTTTSTNTSSNPASPK